jgi:drug/metabolite transporter (DMT)-like permease
MVLFSTVTHAKLRLMARHTTRPATTQPYRDHVRSGNPATRGTLLGLAAAASFGASTPFAKRLLDGGISPQLLAGLLYLGAFLALAAILPTRRSSHEARIRRSDAPRLGALILVGGVLAPLCMLIGLERVSGATGSLLLNLEGPFTLIIGIAVFHEHLGRWAWTGALIIFGAAALLAGNDAGADQVSGVVLIAAAAALWGLDNNLTQSLTLRDPFQLVTIKVGAAAGVNLTIAVALGASATTMRVVLSALLLGAVSYGLSIVLDAYALRLLGAAREAALFATAPFLGMALSVPVLNEQLGASEITGAALMALGVVMMSRERHAHLHTHELLRHDNAHVHDDHHHHQHAPGTATAEPHAHTHEHQDHTHVHTHVSDIHHRHRH